MLAVMNEQLGTLKELERKRQQLAKPASENDNVTNALDVKLKSFSTYAGINLDQEKKRILDSYGIK